MPYIFFIALIFSFGSFAGDWHCPIDLSALGNQESFFQEANNKILSCSTEHTLLKELNSIQKKEYCDCLGKRGFWLEESERKRKDFNQTLQKVSLEAQKKSLKKIPEVIYSRVEEAAVHSLVRISMNKFLSMHGKQPSRITPSSCTIPTETDLVNTLSCKGKILEENTKKIFGENASISFISKKMQNIVKKVENSISRISLDSSNPQLTQDCSGSAKQLDALAFSIYDDNHKALYKIIHKNKDGIKKDIRELIASKQYSDFDKILKKYDPDLSGNLYASDPFLRQIFEPISKETMPRIFYFLDNVIPSDDQITNFIKTEPGKGINYKNDWTLKVFGDLFSDSSTSSTNFCDQKEITAMLDKVLCSDFDPLEYKESMELISDNETAPYLNINYCSKKKNKDTDPSIPIKWGLMETSKSPLYKIGENGCFQYSDKKMILALNTYVEQRNLDNNKGYSQQSEETYYSNKSGDNPENPLQNGTNQNSGTPPDSTENFSNQPTSQNTYSQNNSNFPSNNSISNSDNSFNEFSSYTIPASLNNSSADQIYAARKAKIESIQREIEAVQNNPNISESERISRLSKLNGDLNKLTSENTQLTDRIRSLEDKIEKLVETNRAKVVAPDDVTSKETRSVSNTEAERQSANIANNDNFSKGSNSYRSSHESSIVGDPQFDAKLAEIYKKRNGGDATNPQEKNLTQNKENSFPTKDGILTFYVPNFNGDLDKFVADKKIETSSFIIKSKDGTYKVDGTFVELYGKTIPISYKLSIVDTSTNTSKPVKHETLSNKSIYRIEQLEAIINNGLNASI